MSEYDSFHEQAEELVEKWVETFAPLDKICYATQGRLDKMVGDAIRAAYKFGRIEALETPKETKKDG